MTMATTKKADGARAPRVAEALRGEQLNEGDLAHLLRLQGIDDRKDVRAAFVERDHELSVIRTPAAESAQKKDAPRVMEMAGR